MNNPVLTHLIRFVLLVLLQLLLKRAAMGWQGYFFFAVMVYPLFIILLPLRTPNVLVVLLGFLTGLTVDLIYGTPGLHATATLVMAYLRSFVFDWIEPREGYKINSNPNKEDMGTVWFFQYAAIMMGAHLLVYFSVDSFSYVYTLKILAQTAYTFVFSMLLIGGIMLMFNPKT